MSAAHPKANPASNKRRGGGGLWDCMARAARQQIHPLDADLQKLFSLSVPQFLLTRNGHMEQTEFFLRLL